jgi:nucleoside-diphosphate-sugar epimerase
MGRHVVVGAGAVGSAVAGALADAGHSVLVVTRRGGGPEHGAVERAAADVTDVARLTELTTGADALYNCANPRYGDWLRDWPPMAAAFLAAAERTGARLVTMSNLYGYGPLDHPMTERDPLAAAGPKGRTRAAMWEAAIAAHHAGRVRVTEARASDFYGPGVTTEGHLGERVVPRVLRQKAVTVLGSRRARHSWTYIPDVGRTLAVLGTDERALGRAWHVPTAPPCSQTEIIEAVAAAAGLPAPVVREAPASIVRLAGVFSRDLRELAEVRYQFEAPFVLDSSAATATFGLLPTPLPEGVATTVAWWRQRLGEAGDLRAPARGGALPTPLRNAPS